MHHTQICHVTFELALALALARSRRDPRPRSLSCNWKQAEPSLVPRQLLRIRATENGAGLGTRLGSSFWDQRLSGRVGQAREPCSMHYQPKGLARLVTSHEQTPPPHWPTSRRARVSLAKTIEGSSWVPHFPRLARNIIDNKVLPLLGTRCSVPSWGCPSSGIWSCNLPPHTSHFTSTLEWDNIIINAQNTLFLTTYVTQLTRVHATMESLLIFLCDLFGKFLILLLSLSDVPACGSVCAYVCVYVYVCPNACMCGMCVSTCTMVYSLVTITQVLASSPGSDHHKTTWKVCHMSNIKSRHNADTI